MRFDLESGTDAAHHAIFDPEALTPSAEAQEDPLEWLEQEVDAGRALGYKTGGMCDFHARLLMDEPLPPELAKHAQQVVEDALLRVPSGTLWMTGAEYAPQFAAGSEDVEDPPLHMGTRLEVTAGNYQADIYLMDWPNDLQDEALAERTSPFDRWFHMTLGVLFACATVFGIPALAILALVFWLRGWQQLPLALVASVVLLAGAFFYAYKLGPIGRMRKALSQLRKELPEAVILLETLPPDADLSVMKGAWFYEDDFPDTEAANA